MRNCLTDLMDLTDLTDDERPRDACLLHFKGAVPRLRGFLSNGELIPSQEPFPERPIVERPAL
jgi:hypothetical protein